MFKHIGQLEMFAVAKGRSAAALVSQAPVNANISFILLLALILIPTLSGVVKIT
jgi:hypothetical protein